MIEENLSQFLATISPNVYPLLLPGTDPPLPAIVYTAVSARKSLGVDGCIYHQFYGFQIDVYSSSYLQAKTLADSLANIHGFQGDFHGLPVGLIRAEPQGERIDSDLYRVITDLLIYM